MTKLQVKLKRANKPRLHEKIVRQIKEMISSGQLAPGDQLLPERQLAETLGVSRTALREALAKLASMGLIEVRPGEGAYIKEISLDFLVEPLATMLLKERESVKDLIEVRIILESKATLLASERATYPDIAGLTWHALRVVEDIQAGADASESDTDFHKSLAVASHNELLVNIMSMLSGLMREAYGPARRRMLSGPNASKYGEHHLGICKAIEAGWGNEAERIMKEHLELAKQETMEFFKGNHSVETVEKPPLTKIGGTNKLK
jgi:GntR family transcriptional repressor for pyruvate dehydrogenase complex